MHLQFPKSPYCKFFIVSFMCALQNTIKRKKKCQINIKFFYSFILFDLVQSLAPTFGMILKAMYGAARVRYALYTFYMTNVILLRGMLTFPQHSSPKHTRISHSYTYRYTISLELSCKKKMVTVRMVVYLLFTCRSFPYSRFYTFCLAVPLQRCTPSILLL